MTIDAAQIVNANMGARGPSRGLVAQPPERCREVLAAVRDELGRHPIWRCQLLNACELGYLTRGDLSFVFSQYYLYSKNFTRYLAALMVNCENDLLRANLSQNLWEEGGGLEPEQRHAQIFRHFLTKGLGLELESIRYEGFTQLFAERYLSACRELTPCAASAFMALGTEGIVSRLYECLVKGLEKAGVERSMLNFFYIHMECDDQHAATLEEMTLTYADQPGWEQSVREGARRALDLRLAFFDELYRELGHRRIDRKLAAVQAHSSACGEYPPQEEVVFCHDEEGAPLYRNAVERLGIDFSVHRVPFATEVLDPRIVRIRPGRNNENHRHAHEAVFCVIQGRGAVRINSAVHAVEAGDLVFVPRWAFHQTENLGDSEMIVLAITDYHFTSSALIGNYNNVRRKGVDSTGSVRS